MSAEQQLMSSQEEQRQPAPDPDSDFLIQQLTAQIQSSPNQQLSELLANPSSPSPSLDLGLLLDALSPNAPPKARPLALLALSRLVAQTSSRSDQSSTSSSSSSPIVTIFGPYLQTCLDDSADGSIRSLSKRIAVVGLLNALAALDPVSSVQLLSEPSDVKLQEVSDEQLAQQSFGLLSKLFSHSVSVHVEEDGKDISLLSRLFHFCVAELLSTLASSTTTRTCLGKDPLASQVQSFVSRHSVSDLSDSSRKEWIEQQTGLLASLACLKIKRGSKDADLPLPQPQSQSTSQSKIDSESEIKSEQSRLGALFISSRDYLLGYTAGKPCSQSNFSLSVCSKEFQLEMSRTSILASLESLSHLTLIKRSFRDRIAKDDALLGSLRAVSGIKTRSKVFPSRSETNEQSDLTASSYDLDSRLSKLNMHSQMASFERTDSAVQYGVVSLISNLVSYAHSKPGAENSKEKAQLRKLKEMANGKSAQVGTDQEDEVEEDPNPIVDQRSTLLIGAGVAQTLVGILFTPDLKGKVSINPSKAIRKELSKAIYGLCVKQDRLNRGRIIQEGGARGLLSLGSLALSEYNESLDKTNVTDASQHAIEPDLDLTACSALSLLLISHPPQIVLGAQSSVNSVLSLMTALYLHPTATDLQRFEAALALTNLSSIDDTSATTISQSKAPKIRNRHDPLQGKTPVQDQTEMKSLEMTIGGSLEALILLENNLMLRRANVELLCNLVARDEGINKIWSGEMDEKIQSDPQVESESKSGFSGEKGNSLKNRNSRARTRLHALVAFSSPSSSSSTSTNLNEKEVHNSVSIPLRLASSGALASLSESPTACSHLLALGPRTLNHLVRLIDLSVAPDLEAFTLKGELEQQPKIQEIDEQDGLDNVETQSRTKKDSSQDEQEEEDSNQEEEEELHLAELNSWPLGSDHASSQLNMRGLAILSSLSSYLAWRSRTQNQIADRYSKQGLSLEKEKEIFNRSGFEKAVRNLIRNGLVELQSKGNIGGTQNPETARAAAEAGAGVQVRKQVEELKKQCIKMGMECLKILKDAGVTS